jgi:hypothetical protein
MSHFRFTSDNKRFRYDKAVIVCKYNPDDFHWCGLLKTANGNFVIENSSGVQGETPQCFNSVTKETALEFALKHASTQIVQEFFGDIDKIADTI